jgi:hypothetical protein
VTEVAHGTVEADRDEPPGARASPRRIEQQPEPSRRFEGDEEKAIPIDGELNLLRQFYGACIDATRRAKPAHERAAAIRALRCELKAAILAITTRHRNEQIARRSTALLRRSLSRDLRPSN